MIDLTIKQGSSVLFRHDELACRGTKQGRLATGFANKLALLRLQFGRGMTVNSCCRSVARNTLVGGHPNSLHIYDAPMRKEVDGTCAIDIGCPDGEYMMDLAWVAANAGWCIGVGKGFLHLDRRLDYGIGKRRVLFGY